MLASADRCLGFSRISGHQKLTNWKADTILHQGIPVTCLKRQASVGVISGHEDLRLSRRVQLHLEGQGVACPVIDGIL